MIIVTEGTLRIQQEAGVTDLAVGERLAFPTSQHYSYVNPGETLTRFVRVVVN